MLDIDNLIVDPVWRVRDPTDSMAHFTDHLMWYNTLLLYGVSFLSRKLDKFFNIMRGVEIDARGCPHHT